MNKIIPVLVAVIICFSVGVMASYFQVDAIQTWYPFLNKPLLTPPNFIFPIVWSILYFCMGISIGLIWNTKHRKRKILRWLFSFQLLLNFTWSIYFFYFQNPYLQPIITQYFIDNKSEIWLLFLIAHSKR